MKRNFWNLVQAAALCVAMTVALPACDDEDEITEGDDDNTENVDPGTDDGTEDSTGGEATTPTENVYVTTDCITPIRYTEGYYVSEGTEDVAITVTSLTTDDIVFTVTPSSEVKSYLVQVYPLASVYNTYLNQMNAEGTATNGTTVYSDLFAHVYTKSVGLQTFDDYWAGNDMVVTASSK